MVTLPGGKGFAMPKVADEAPGARILVINDTQEILDLFRDILEEAGYRVTLIASAVEEMRHITAEAPDLVILDLVFGREFLGWQTLQKMKMTRETASIPVIVCTADVRQVQEVQGYLTEKNVGLLLKPFDIDDLLLLVKRQLALPKNSALTHT